MDKAYEPFGHIHTPRASSGEQTAVYTASSDWERLRRYWQITMYQTQPATRLPVDLPTVEFTPRHEEVAYGQVDMEDLLDLAEARAALGEVAAEGTIPLADVESRVKTR